MSEAGEGEGRLSHLDAQGRARMVDVTGKPDTYRRAEARATVVASGNASLFGPDAPEILAAARVAGLAAAKATSDLVPLCHPLPLLEIDVAFALAGPQVEVRASVATDGKTGVEMEALAACALAALSIVAALGPTSPGVRIEGLGVWEKLGGRSGHWQRRSADEALERAPSLGS